MRTDDFVKALEVKAIIDKEYYKRHTDEDLARRVGLNDYKLKIAFKTVTQKTLHEYVTEVRMEKAKSLLLTTGLHLKIIAQNVGLDQSNLIKQFKKLYGQTPYNWRMDQKSQKIA